MVPGVAPREQEAVISPSLQASAGPEPKPAAKAVAIKREGAADAPRRGTDARGEQLVEGLPAPRLPGDAPAGAGVAAIKSEAKSAKFKTRSPRTEPCPSTSGGVIAAVEPAIKRERAAGAPRPDAAGAPAGQQLGLFTLAELAVLVDACAVVRALGAADDCTHQAMLVLWLLRGGDPAALAARAAATPRDCEWRWLVSLPEAHDVKREPAVTGARLERDSGAAPELNPRDPAAVRVDVDLSAGVKEVFSFRPAPADTGIPRRGQTAFRGAPAAALEVRLLDYARVSPQPGPADFGWVVLLHDVPAAELASGGVHGHMVVYYHSKDTGLVYGGAGGEAGGAGLRLGNSGSGLGGAARPAGGVQGGARRLQRAAAVGRGPAAGPVGQQPAAAQEGAGSRRA